MSKELTLHGFPIKLGDRVWSFASGWGTVTAFNPVFADYKLRVKHDNEIVRTYTTDGKEFLHDKGAILHWNEVVFEFPAKPCPPVFEYKILYKNNVGEHNLTSKFYTSLDEYLEYNGRCLGELIELFEPSKRVRQP